MKIQSSIKQLTLAILVILMSDSMNAASSERLLYNFETPEQSGVWRIVNDGVMGGLSRGNISITQERTAIFTGNISLDNNGGFSSTRTAPQQYNLEGFNGILIRVRGDGRTYQLRLRMGDRFDGIAYRYPFVADDTQWATIIVPFSECVPVFRGRVVDDAPALEAAKIEQIGFLLADKTEGPFRLEVDWIKAYK